MPFPFNDSRAMTSVSNNNSSSVSPGSWESALEAEIDDRQSQLVDMRRYLHANPEISGKEEQTSQFLYEKLDRDGFQVRIGPHGCGVLVDPPTAVDVKAARGCVAIRADIDALRIQDEKTVAYRSCRPGVMHACGHDVHTTVVYGALTALRELATKNLLPWPVNYRGIFQPAEETIVGATEMVEAGALDGVDVILANHVDPTREVGRIGLREGVLTANAEAMNIRITGRGGHAARPHEAIDPIAVAAQLINAIYLFVPRATDSQDSVVVTIGQMVGGDNPNVIPEEIELLGTLRSLRGRVRTQTMRHIRQLCHGVSEASGANIEVEFEKGTGSVKNAPGLVALLRDAVGSVLDPESVDEIARPSMGSEDFAAYLEHVPGAMFRLGTTTPGEEPTPLHTPKFDVDERAIAIGAKVLAHAAVLWSDPAAS